MKSTCTCINAVVLGVQTCTYLYMYMYACLNTIHFFFSTTSTVANAEFYGYTFVYYNTEFRGIVS